MIKYIATYLSIFSFVHACDEDVLKMSVLCQNLGYTYALHGGVNIGLHADWSKDERHKLEKLMEGMVKKGVLIEQYVEMNAVTEKKKEEKLIQYIELLGSKYGMFTAEKMLDLGFDRRIFQIDYEQPFELKLRMPKKDLANFLEFLSREDMGRVKEGHIFHQDIIQ